MFLKKKIIWKVLTILGLDPDLKIGKSTYRTKRSKSISEAKIAQDITVWDKAIKVVLTHIPVSQQGININSDTKN